jgi:hypothetical protein
MSIMGPSINIGKIAISLVLIAGGIGNLKSIRRLMAVCTFLSALEMLIEGKPGESGFPGFICMIIAVGFVLLILGKQKQKQS